MSSCSLRLRGVAAAITVAVSAGLAAPAAADTTGSIDMNITAVSPAHILTVVNTETVTASEIVDLQSILGASSGITSTGGTDVVNEVAVGNNAVVDESLNLIFSRTKGNNASNAIGTANADGAIILIGQEIVPNGGGTALAATTDDSLILALLSGTGQNVTATVNENTVEAAVAFNANFATVDVIVPAGLSNGTQGEYLSALTLGGANPGFLFPTAMDQTANLNVASVQAAAGYANGNGALTTARIEDSLIMLGRFFPDVADASVSGNFEVIGNVVDGRTLGNAADNSIFLFSGAVTSFAGTAFVSATQMSRDSSPPAAAIPISASNANATIQAVFAVEPFILLPSLDLADLVGPAFFLSGDRIAVSVDRNAISSSATINSARNELGFDSALALDGPSTDVSIRLGLGTNAGGGDTVVQADYGAVNNQTAGCFSPLAFCVPYDAQRVLAFTQNAQIRFAIEDIDGASSISVSENLIAASAAGQFGTNVIRNHGPISPVTDLGEDSSAIVGSFASANRQHILEEVISATVSDSAIIAAVGIDDNADDAFGGIVGSTLHVDGNVISARATGNGATVLVDLAGLSFDPAAGLVGGQIESDRLVDLLSIWPRNVQLSSAGVNLASGQVLDMPRFILGGVSALLQSTDILVLVNHDDGTVDDTEAPQVAQSTISLDDNAMIAAATLEVYDATATIAADTGFQSSIAALGFQQASADNNARHLAASEVTGGSIAVNIGVNGSADSSPPAGLTVSVDGNEALSLARGNDIAQRIDVHAGTSILVGADELGGGNALVQTDTAASRETMITEIDALGAFLAVSDQAARDTQAESRIDDFEIELLLATVAADAAQLSDSVLSLSGNSLISQALGNTARNEIELEAETSIAGGAEAAAGAIAGIVSVQSASNWPVPRRGSAPTPSSRPTCWTADCMPTSLSASTRFRWAT